MTVDSESTKVEDVCKNVKKRIPFGKNISINLGSKKKKKTYFRWCRKMSVYFANKDIP